MVELIFLEPLRDIIYKTILLVRWLEVKLEIKSVSKAPITCIPFIARDMPG